MCNCKDINECPVEGACKTEGVVYKVVVENENGESKVYVGCTESSFKKEGSTASHHSNWKNIKTAQN